VTLTRGTPCIYIYIYREREREREEEEEEEEEDEEEEVQKPYRMLEIEHTRPVPLFHTLSVRKMFYYTG
jgi:CO dehydrogenase/acetyl-CoA synthase beta subunit